MVVVELPRRNYGGWWLPTDPAVLPDPANRKLTVFPPSGIPFLWEKGHGKNQPVELDPLSM